MSDDDDWGDGGVSTAAAAANCEDDWGDGGAGGDDEWGGGGGGEADPFSPDGVASGMLGGQVDDYAAAYENTYYEADDAASAGDLTLALELFQKVMALEVEHPELGDAQGSDPYGFMSAKSCVEIFANTERPDEAVSMFMNLLRYLTGRKITIAKFEDTFYTLLEKLSRFPQLQVMQEATLRAFADANQELPRIRVLLRVARQLFAGQNWSELAPKLNELRHCCQQQGLTQQLIEVLALEMQMHEVHGRQSIVKQIWLEYFSKDRESHNSLIGPEVKAVVDFLGGKSLLIDHLYSEAATAFYRATTHYDDVGNQDGAERALGYRLFAEMLKPKDPRKKDVDPFAEARTKIYLTRDSIAVFSNAYQAFHRQDVAALMSIFDGEKVLSGDAFLRGFRDALFSNLRLSMIARICPCYTQLRIASLADELLTTPDEAERLLALCIEDESVRGHIDQVRSVFCAAPPDLRSSFFSSIRNWSSALHSLSSAWSLPYSHDHAVATRT